MTFDQQGKVSLLDRGTPYPLTRMRMENYRTGIYYTVYNDEQGKPLLFFDGRILYDYKFREVFKCDNIGIENEHFSNVFILPHLVKKDVYLLFMANLESFDLIKKTWFLKRQVYCVEIYVNKSTDVFKVIKDKTIFNHQEMTGLSAIYDRAENTYKLCTVDDFRTCACYTMTECGVDSFPDKKFSLDLQNKNINVTMHFQRVSYDQQFIMVEDFHTNPPTPKKNILEVYKYDSLSKGFNFYCSVPSIYQSPSDSTDVRQIDPIWHFYHFSRDSKHVYIVDSYGFTCEFDLASKQFSSLYEVGSFYMEMGPNGKFYEVQDEGFEGDEKPVKFYEIEFLGNGQYTKKKITETYRQGNYGFHLDIPSFYYDSTYQKPTPVEDTPINITGLGHPLCTDRVLEAENVAVNYDSTVWRLKNQDQAYVFHGQKLDYKKIEPGNYTLTLEFTERCQKRTATYDLKVEDRPYVKILADNPALLCVNQSKEIKLETNSVDFVWNTGELDPSIIVKQTGLLVAEARNSCGLAKDSINVAYEEIEIPNVITPNGDDKNETFRVLDYTGKYGLSVFNRNGSLLFQEMDYQEDWPSTRVADGTYFYEIQTQNQCHYKGWVQLLH